MEKREVTEELRRQRAAEGRCWQGGWSARKDGREDTEQGCAWAEPCGGDGVREGVSGNCGL